MIRTTTFFASLLLVVGFTLAGCDTVDNDDPVEGQMRLYLTDAPTDSLASAFVTIDQIRLIDDDSLDVDEEDEAALDSLIVLDEPVTLDLLALRDSTAWLADVVLPSEDYGQIRLIVSGSDNYVVPENDLEGEIPLKTPSGQQSGLKIDLPDYDLDEDGEVIEVLLDFDAEASIHRAGQSGKYVLRPVIELTAFEVNGEELDLDEMDE